MCSTWAQSQETAVGFLTISCLTCLRSSVHFLTYDTTTRELAHALPGYQPGMKFRAFGHSP